MGIFDRVFGKKGVKLGETFVPLKDMPKGLDEKDFISVGDSKEAAYDLLQYVCEVAQIKQAEADWSVFPSIQRLEEVIPGVKRVSTEWYFSLQYIRYLINECRLETEKLIEERYTPERPQPTVRYLVEKVEGTRRDANVPDALADLGDINALVKMFPETTAISHAYPHVGKEMGTASTGAIVWALARLSDPAATEALKALADELPGTVGRTPLVLSNIAVSRDVDVVVSRLEEICDFTKRVERPWGLNPKSPSYTGPWPSGLLFQSTRPEADDEWRWASYVLKQWGNERAILVLQCLYPLLDFYEKARVKMLIRQYGDT